MRRLLSCATKAPGIIRTMRPPPVSPVRLKHTSPLLCTSSLQGDTATCNGTHCKKALLSDPQLFEAQFDELVTELSERDLADPALADALNRLREVCKVVLCVAVSPSSYLHMCFFLLTLRCWCIIPLEARGTGACL